MKKPVCFLLILLLAVASLLSACSVSDNASASRGEVIGSINGVDVYKGELDYYMNYQFSSYYSNYYNLFKLYYNVDLLEEESAKEILGDMEYASWQYIVEAHIILQLAEQYGISFAGEYLQDVLSWGDYCMLEVNSVYNDLYNAVKEELLSEVVVSDADAQAVYDADPAKWNGVKTSHILISCDVTDEAAKVEAYNKAMEVIEKLNAGGDFATLAAEYSSDSSAANGGVVDYIFNEAGEAIDGSTSVFAEYAAGAFALSEVGAYSQEPVLSSAGYHIIKLDSLYNDFESVKSYIADSLKTVSDDEVENALAEKIQSAKNEAKIEEMKYTYYVPTLDDTDDADTTTEPTNDTTDTSDDNQGTTETTTEPTAE